MFYLIYRITNTINGKTYIGAHKTTNKDDGYMGSGKYLKNAIKKYGIDNFTKTILLEANSSEEMFQKEQEFVEIGPHSYNLKQGGEGGWDHITKEHYTHSSDHIHKMNLARIEKLKNPEYKKEFGQKISKVLKGRPFSIEHRAKIVAKQIGRKMSEQTKQKIGQSNKKNVGIKNSQFGTMWITNGTESKKVNKTLVIPEGWRQGRKLK